MTTLAASTATYQIADYRVPALVEAIDRLARRAGRLGVAPITLSTGEPHDLPFVRRRSDGRPYLTPYRAEDGDLATLERDGRITYRRFVDVTITGAVPRLAGWTFCATLQHVDGEGGEALTMLRVAPGAVDGDLPERFRTAKPEDCDHCRRRIRTRKETFVVRHDDGRWAQVGRNCTQDFLGGVDPHAVAGALDLLLEAHAAASSAGEGDEWGEGGGWADRWPMRQFLAVVATLVRVDGWMSRGKARDLDGVQATADAAIEYLSPPPRDSVARDRWLRWIEARPVTDEDQALAERALLHARTDLAEKPALNDYEHNLRVATAIASVDGKLAGIVASLITYYLREVERTVVREQQRATSRHLGAVKDRLILEVTVARIIVVGEMSAYGPSYLHRMVTATGDVVVWFASNKGDMAEGKTYHVKATVKKHDTRDGVAQTVVSRVDVITAEQAEAEAVKAQRKAQRAAARAAAAPTA
ncbi:MAG: hypothetical protein E6Q97_39470 [Desulfurellales bacterium]|nr:MAG: hypothetical protein E6Q97_39470 [Desulfurellales bacterium]